MVHWKEVLTQITPDAKGRMAELRGRLWAQMGGIGPVKIIAFRGYGTTERLYLRGRVIEEKISIASEKNDRVWADLVRIYTHAQSTRVPEACLVARFQNLEQSITADEEGFFEVRFEPSRPLAANRIWHSIEIQLVSPIPDMQSRYPIKATGQVLVPPVTARCAVISDIDSSLLPTGAARLAYMARSAFLRSPHPRLTFPGEAALYRVLYGGLAGMEMNPLFYLSSSTSSLYDLLVQHINLQSMPNGPVLFANNDKRVRIQRMLDLYPHLPFLLVGDSDKQDAEIYASLAAAYPGRILAILIRAQGCGPRRAERIRRLAEPSGAPLILADNALDLARQLIELNLISVGSLDSIAGEMEKDICPPGPLETLIGQTGEMRGRPEKISRQDVKKEEAAPDGEPDESEESAWRPRKPAARRADKKNK